MLFYCSMFVCKNSNLTKHNFGFNIFINPTLQLNNNEYMELGD